MSDWEVLSATALGGSHRRRGAPNQDAFAVRETDRGCVLAVADGHGGRRYVRSERGSAYAVQLTVELATQALAAGLTGAQAARGLPERLLPAWRAEVMTDVGRHPFTEEEADRAGTDPGDGPLLSYGATLICAIVAPDGISLCQIGDGDAVVLTRQGPIHPVPDDARLFADQTTSLCTPDALGDFRFATVPDAHGPTVVLLSSDGYGKSFADRNWAGSVVEDLARQVREEGRDAVQAALPRWIAESARVGGDDVTAVIAVRRAPAGDAALGSAGAPATAGVAVTTAGAGVDPTEPPGATAARPPTPQTAASAADAPTLIGRPGLAVGDEGTRTAPGEAPAASAPRRAGVRIALLLLALVGLLAVGAFALLQRGGPAPAPVTPTPGTSSSSETGGGLATSTPTTGPSTPPETFTTVPPHRTTSTPGESPTTASETPTSGQQPTPAQTPQTRRPAGHAGPTAGTTTPTTGRT